MKSEKLSYFVVSRDKSFLPRLLHMRLAVISLTHSLFLPHNRPCRAAYHCCTSWNVPCHHCASSHYSPFADGHSGQNDCPSAYPHVSAYVNWPCTHPALLAQLHVFVVLCRVNVHARANPHIVADVDSRIRLEHAAEVDKHILAKMDIGSRIENAFTPQLSYAYVKLQ